MKILAINHFYLPDQAATSRMLADLCEDLVTFGDEVTVIASQVGYLAGAPRLASDEVIRGVRVQRPWTTGYGKGSLIHRMADSISFIAAAIGAAARQMRPDVILTLTSPPLLGAGAAMVAGARRIPLVLWMQDAFPDAVYETGHIDRYGLAGTTLSAVMKWTLRECSRIVALSEGMTDRIERQGAPPNRLRVVRNWADGRCVQSIAHKENAFRREHGLENAFVVMYSGNLGIAHNPVPFIQAARVLETEIPHLVFVFIGDGVRRKEAAELARGLQNVRFLPYQPHERLTESLSAADVHLISLRDELEGLVVPSKLYGALASGRPVFYLGPEGCEVARTIREHRVGWAGSSTDAEGLIAALRKAANSPSWCADTGARARQVLLTHYDRPIAMRDWRAVLEEAVAEGKT